MNAVVEEAERINHHPSWTNVSFLPLDFLLVYYYYTDVKIYPFLLLLHTSSYK